MTMQERDEIHQEIIDLNFWGVLYFDAELSVQRVDNDKFYWSDIGSTFYHKRLTVK